MKALRFKPVEELKAGQTIRLMGIEWTVAFPPRFYEGDKQGRGYLVLEGHYVAGREKERTMCIYRGEEIEAGGQKYYCPEHHYTPEDNSGFNFCPMCEVKP